MNILDWISLMLIGAFVVFCVFKGLKRLSFRLCAFIVAMLMAKLSGHYLGDFLLSDIIQIESGLFGEKLTEKINDVLVSLLGTLILFIWLSVLLKRIFAIVEDRMERSYRVAFIDKIWGALTGIFDGMAFAFVFTEIVTIVDRAAFKRKQELCGFIDGNNRIIYKLARILN